MTEVSRRAVLTGGLAAAGAIVVGIDVLGGEVAGASTPKRSLPRRAEYERSVGKVFTARHGGVTRRLRLARIHNVAHATRAQGDHSFNLIFVPVGSARLPDAIYVMRSAHTRSHELFLSGVGRDGALQALVNRTR